MKNELKFIFHLIFISFIRGCSNNQPKNEISKEYVLNFWNVFKNGEFNEMATKYYDNKVILLPRAILSYKSLGISSEGFSLKAKKYSKIYIFKAYYNLEKELGGLKKWKYLFSNKNMKVEKKSMELSTVANSRSGIKPYIKGKKISIFYYISNDNIVFVIRPFVSKVYDKLIFVFSYNTHKIIAQTIILTFPGSKYFNDFNNLN